MTPKNSTDWKAVKAEIIADLQKEKRKEEVEAGLKGRHAVGDFFRHPAVIVALTFVLTSLLGTTITSAWQQNQHELERKYALVDELNSAVVQYLIAAEDIVGLYQQEEGAPNREEIEKERWTFWQQRSREWRLFADALPPKLKANFTNDEIGTEFAAIAEKTEDISYKIKDLKSEVEGTKWAIVKETEFQTRAEYPLRRSDEVRKQTSALLLLMENDIRGRSHWTFIPRRWI